MAYHKSSANRYVNIIKALASYIAIALNNYRKSQEIKEKASELKVVNSRLSVEITKRKTAQKNLVEANKKLKDLLSMDTLTGIFNRRGFEQFLRLEWRRSEREGIPLSIILIDIDFFKEYNDKHGHLPGDACLKKVSNCLLAAIKRPMDLLARYGGEEFIVILPNTEAGGALNMAEAMRQSVEALNIIHGKSIVSPYITISLGVSTIIPARKSSQKEFINSADQALYRAKQGGRNKVCSSLEC
jgi:diguanylate cyclase (GGDEF)-like protein